MHTAVTRPWGLRHSAKRGIVSPVRRHALWLQSLAVQHQTTVERDVVPMHVCKRRSCRSGRRRRQTGRSRDPRHLPSAVCPRKPRRRRPRSRHMWQPPLHQTRVARLRQRGTCSTRSTLSTRARSWSQRAWLWWRWPWRLASCWRTRSGRAGAVGGGTGTGGSGVVAPHA